MTLEILTADELATLLGCGATHVKSLASEHQLPVIRYGRSWRFPITALNEFFNAQALRHLNKNLFDEGSGPTALIGRPVRPLPDLTKTVQVAIPLPNGEFRRIR